MAGRADATSRTATIIQGDHVDLMTTDLPPQVPDWLVADPW
jgi:hypothetical protein